MEFKHFLLTRDHHSINLIKSDKRQHSIEYQGDRSICFLDVTGQSASQAATSKEHAQKLIRGCYFYVLYLDVNVLLASVSSLS